MLYILQKGLLRSSYTSILISVLWQSAYCHRVLAEATLESTSKREEQLRQLDELLEQSGEIKDSRVFGPKRCYA